MTPNRHVMTSGRHVSGRARHLSYIFLAQILCLERTMQYMLRGPAAEYISGKFQGLKMTATALANLASKGKGPEYGILNGRAVYTREGCDKWIAEQVARPATESRRGRPAKRSEHAAA
jgi:hypothetical protein